MPLIVSHMHREEYADAQHNDTVHARSERCAAFAHAAASYPIASRQEHAQATMKVRSSVRTPGHVSSQWGKLHLLLKNRVGVPGLALYMFNARHLGWNLTFLVYLSAGAIHTHGTNG